MDIFDKIRDLMSPKEVNFSLAFTTLKPFSFIFAYFRVKDFSIKFIVAKRGKTQILPKIGAY